MRSAKWALPVARSAACQYLLVPPGSSHSSTKTCQIRSRTLGPTQRWKVR